MSHETGIFFGIPMPVYRQADGINQSSLKEMAISPGHYKSRLSEPQKEPTEAMVIGTIIHSAVLENDRSGFVVMPDDYDGRTSEGKKWRAAQTKPSIKSEVATNISGMIASVKRHSMASRILFGEGNNEVSGWANHKDTGLLIKARADRLAMDAKQNTVCVDLKTTDRGGASESEFSKSILSWGYDVQCAYYMDLFQCSYFVFVCVEKLPPYAVNCFSMAQETIEIGRRKYESYLAKIKQCEDSGEWPCYGEDLKMINLPEWVVRKESK